MTVIQIRLGLSNAYLIKGDKPILVDTGSPGEADKICRALARADVDIRDLALILHTHGHSDHCGSTHELQQRSQAPVAIHRLDAPMLQRGANNRLRPTRTTARLLKPFVDKPFAGTNADILIDGELSLAPYGIDGRVLHTPGHTPGSISLLLSSGAAIVGDIMMGGHLGGTFFATRPRYHYFADDLAQVRRSIDSVMQHAPSRVYVGHGGPLAPAAITAQFGQMARHSQDDAI